MKGLGRYPEYRESGLAWLGEVPAHWEVRRSKLLFREVDRRSVDGSETHLSMSQVHGLVPNSQVESWRMVSETYAGGKLCEEDDLVLNRLKAHLGVFARAPMAGVISPDYTVFRKRVELETAYFEYAYKTPLLKAELRMAVRGIVEGFWRLYTDDFGDIRVPVPPLDEQRRIVAVLDAHDAKVRRFVRAKRRMIGSLVERKKAVVQEALAPGACPITEGRLKTFADNVVLQTDRMAPNDVYIALEDVESWTGRAAPRAYPVEFGSAVKRFETGDVLFGKLRPYLAKVLCADRAGVAVGEFLVVRPRPGAIEPDLLAQIMRSASFIDEVNALTYGTRMPRAEWQLVGTRRIRFPTAREDQLTVLSRIDAQTAEIDAAIARIEREIALVREYRERLVADVVTGKLDVRSVQLDDETLNEERDEDALLDAEDDEDEGDAIHADAAE